MSAYSPEQAAAHAFVSGCVARGITASQAAVPPEGQLSAVRGLWADVAAAAAGAAGEELEELRRRVAEYEGAVTWETSCLSCARLLDSCYAETVRREQAEAELGAVRADARCPETLVINGEPAVRCLFFRGHDPGEDDGQRVHDDGNGTQWMAAEPEAPEPDGITP